MQFGHEACWWWGSVPAFFFSLVLQGLNSGAVRAVWPRACRRRGCAPVALLVRASHRCGRVRERLRTCGGGRHTLAGARLPPSWASPGTAPRGVAAAGNPVIACQGTPPTVAGESGIGSAQCGSARQAPPPSVQAWMLVGARLPLSRASPATASRGVASVDFHLL
jgi:hypothetical protein